MNTLQTTFAVAVLTTLSALPKLHAATPQNAAGDLPPELAPLAAKYQSAVGALTETRRLPIAGPPPVVSIRAWSCLVVPPNFSTTLPEGLARLIRVNPAFCMRSAGPAPIAKTGPSSGLVLVVPPKLT
jgi:hypothetical protein